MQSGDSFRLIVRRGPQPNQIFELRDDVVSLGRDITNNIVINDREVSRHHLRFTRGADGYTVEDLGSTNGTFVNGKRVSGAILLKNGDMIGLGETVTLGYELARPNAEIPAATVPQSPQPVASPYQPPQPVASPYQPPQPAASPYKPPSAEPYRPTTPPAQDPYAPVPPYGSDPYQVPAQDPYYAGAQGYGAPPPPGYDYDPYAMREPAPNNTARLFLFGCLGLLMFCCCISIVAFIAIDQLNLYCRIPLLNDILEALGLIRCAIGGA